jgi:hypothetical protein
LIYHRSAAELRFIDEDTTYPLKVLPIHLRIGEHLEISVLLDPHARTNHLRAEAIIQGGLDENYLLSLTTIVMRDREEVKGLGATYSAVSEIELCHA